MKALSTRNIFISVLVFWLVIVAGMLTYYQMPLIYGQEVVVKVEPADPRDFFRGDYVILSYGFSRLDFEKYLGDDRDALLAAEQDEHKKGGLPDQSRIYTQLKRVEEQYVVESFSREPIESAELINIKGVAKKRWSSADNYRVEYGVESFFVPEGKGLTLERLRNEDRLKAVLMVDAFGRAVIKDLLVDDEPLDLDALEFELDKEFDELAETAREILTTQGEVKFREPTNVITFNYGENWTYNKQTGVLSHIDATASIRFRVSGTEDYEQSVSCDASDPEELACSAKQLSWQPFEHRETVGEYGHRDVYHKVTGEDDSKKYYEIIALIQPDDEELWSEVETILSTVWVKDF